MTGPAHASAPAPAPAPLTKGERTRAALVQIGAELFGRHGYRATSMADLVAASGLTRGAFYFHFDSKRELARAVIEDKQRAWLQQVAAALDEHASAADQLRALGPAMVRLHEQDPTAWSYARLGHELSQDPELGADARAALRAWLDHLTQLIARGQEEGTIARDVDAAVLAEVLVGAVDGIKQLGDAHDEGSHGPEAFARRLAALQTIVALALL